MENKTHEDLDNLFLQSNPKTKVIKVNINKDKYIIFSDQHKGKGVEGKDDFKPCRNTYDLALRNYYDKNFRLIVLGDSEELWEVSDFQNILQEYNDIYYRENRFYKKNKQEDEFYIKVFGNHDFKWIRQEVLNNEMPTDKFVGIKAYEAIIMQLYDAETKLGEILLFHGHQGHYKNLFATWLKASLVKSFWGALQIILKKPLNESPSSNKVLAEKVNKAIYSWAATNNKIVIYGHTHHAMFNSLYYPEMTPVVANAKPICFNTGCCSFGDGSIVGIEIADKQIHLVQAFQDKETQIIDSKNLVDLFN